MYVCNIVMLLLLSYCFIDVLANFHITLTVCCCVVTCFVKLSYCHTVRFSGFKIVTPFHCPVVAFSSYVVFSHCDIVIGVDTRVSFVQHSREFYAKRVSHFAKKCSLFREISV